MLLLKGRRGLRNGSTGSFKIDDSLFRSGRLRLCRLVCRVFLGQRLGIFHFAGLGIVFVFLRRDKAGTGLLGAHGLGLGRCRSRFGDVAHGKLGVGVFRLDGEVQIRARGRLVGPLGLRGELLVAHLGRHAILGNFETHFHRSAIGYCLGHAPQVEVAHRGNKGRCHRTGNDLLGHGCAACEASAERAHVLTVSSSLLVWPPPGDQISSSLQCLTSRSA